MTDIHHRDTGSAELNRILAERDRIHAALRRPRQTILAIPPLPTPKVKSFKERIAEADKLRGKLSSHLIKHIKYSIRQSAIDCGEIPAPTKDQLGCTTISEIQYVVAEHFNIDLDQMLSGRLANMSFPRQVAMYLAKKITRQSLHYIGRHFCGRDHATVIYAVRKIELLIMTDGVLASKITALKEKLG